MSRQFKVFEMRGERTSTLVVHETIGAAIALFSMQEGVGSLEEWEARHGPLQVVEREPKELLCLERTCEQWASDGPKILVRYSTGEVFRT